MKKLFYLLALLLFLSCSNDSESDLIEINNPPEGLTYNGNIKAIIDSNCLACHTDPTTNGAPFPLVTYEQVLVRAQNGQLLRSISRQTGEAVAMPPSGRLPQNTINTIEQWINDGAPEN